MKKASIGMMTIVLSFATMTIGCQSTKQEKEFNSLQSEASTVLSEESSVKEADDTTDSSSENTSATKETTTEVTKLSSESSTSINVIKNAEEMEKAFLDACKDSIESVTEKDSNEETTIRSYSTNAVHILFRVHTNTEAAQATIREMIDYGGWYEEDCVVKGITIDEAPLFLQAYYCKTPDGADMLFVLGYNDTVSFAMEGHDTAHVENIEKILLAMGIDLKSK